MTARTHATILPPVRREVPVLHVPAGPEAIPDEVHDVPAVRRVGVAAYRAQASTIAADLRAALELECATRRETIRRAMTRALTMGAANPADIEPIVDRVMSDEIAAGRL